MYDLICIGAGIANLSLAYHYLKYNNKKVLILEEGSNILNRHCPKDKTGQCINCKPCQITTGFAGAGCFSDSKLTYSEQVGGTLIDYTGKEKFKELQDKAKLFYKDLGANSPIYTSSDYFKQFRDKCKENDLILVESEVQHLGTEGSYELMVELYNRLKNMGCDIQCRSAVTDIDFNNHKVFYSEKEVQYKKLSIAVGRYGSEWLNKICKQNDIALEENSVDIGVRIEVPHYITKEVTDNLYEMKIINKISDSLSVRTFCVNPQGYVVQENYKDVKCVNGHSFANQKSDNTNFALLVSCKFTEPFNNPIEYGKAICKLSNMLGGNHILVQRLGDLINNRRTNEIRLNDNSVKPTLTDAVPGDIRYAIPDKILNAILDTLNELNSVINGIWNEDILLYSPEVKFYSSKIKLNDNLQTHIPDVYFLGDSSGVTHGIIQACMSGIYISEKL